MGICVLHEWEASDWLERRVEPDCKRHMHVRKGKAADLFHSKEAEFAGIIGKKWAIKMKPKEEIVAFKVVLTGSKMPGAPRLSGFQYVKLRGK